MERAILDGKKVVACEDLLTWAAWYEHSPNRIVRQTTINRRKHILVSTVFLALNHDFRGTNAGIWFETMVLGGGMNDYQVRYATWEEAELNHAKVVGYARHARQSRRRKMDFRKFLKRNRRLLK